MSVVARDQSTADKLVFVWPEPVSWGVELSCTEDEVAVICPDWIVGEQLGPGRHTVNLPSPANHILVYFVRTAPVTVPFESVTGVFDRSSGALVPVHYTGSMSVKVGDPLLLCREVLGVPSQDLSAGVLRSAASSMNKALQVMIKKVVMASPAVSALAAPTTVSQLIRMTASGNPMAIAVSGLEFLRFEEFNLSVDGGAAVRGNVEHVPAVGATDETVRVSHGQGQGQGQDTGPHIPLGAHVLVYWNDGLWHAGTIRQFREGSYEVALDGLAGVAWVPADHVRPA